MLAADAHINLAHAVALSFGDVVDEIELAGLFEKPGVGSDVGKDKAATAINISD